MKNTIKNPQINPKDTSFSLKKRLLSFQNAYRGIKFVFVTQHNAWIHSAATFLVIIMGLILGVSMIEWCILVITIGIVIALEVLNTAVEELVNHVSPQFDKKAGLVKDIAAGAVLVSAIAAVIIGIMIFVPKILLYLIASSR